MLRCQKTLNSFIHSFPQSCPDVDLAVSRLVVPATLGHVGSPHNSERGRRRLPRREGLRGDLTRPRRLLPWARINRCRRNQNGCQPLEAGPANVQRQQDPVRASRPPQLQPCLPPGRRSQASPYAAVHRTLPHQGLQREDPAPANRQQAGLDLNRPSQTSLPPQRLPLSRPILQSRPPPYQDASS